MESDLFPEDTSLPEQPRRGRGAVGSPQPRFAAWSRHAVDDGWSNHGGSEEELPPLDTQLFVDTAKTVISHNDSPDLPFEQSINPYRGCEHGCVYCYARPSHAFLGHSPGLDFETLLYQKPDAARLLRRELSRPGYQCKPIAIGTNTDAWQPVERRLHITRAILETLLELQHPAMLITKSSLVERDVDVLSRLAAKNLVHAAISLTTLDSQLARRLEPRAPSPRARLRTIKTLSSAGIPVCVMVSPVIPGLNDHEIEHILAEARAAGASAAHYSILRLSHELHELFESWLSWHAPEKAARVMALLYDIRSGKIKDNRFNVRMQGLGHFADLIAQRFALHRRKLGFTALPPLDCSRFINKKAQARPRGDEERQLDLF